MGKPPLIVHVTPIRPDFEPRTVFACESAVEAGYRVALVAPAERDSVRRGVEIRALPRPRNRLDRVTRISWLAVRRTLALGPDLVQFHDPEFVLWGLAFRLRGIPVVYDVHEDYALAVGVRHWLPRPLRPLAALFMRGLSALARRLYPQVIAERSYAAVFPEAVPVLNHARLAELAPLLARVPRPPADRIRLLYTGNVTRSRGGAVHAALLDHLPERAEVHLIGHCPEPDLARELRRRAARDPRLVLRIDERAWVPREEIVAAYGEPWTAMVALFPDSDQYRDTEPTKFFEAMAAGIPVICSDFPMWRALVEGEGVGFTVPPADAAAAAERVRWLAGHPAEAEAMGRRAQHLVRTRYNWETQARNLLDLYRRLLTARGVAVPEPAAAGESGP